MSARIKTLEAPYDEETDALLKSMMPPGVPPLNLFKTWAKNLRISGKYKNSNLLDRGVISLREREILILRTTGVCGSEYEWGVHVSFFGQKAAFTKEQIASTIQEQFDSKVWEAKEVNLLSLVDQLHNKTQITDELWELLIKDWSEEQLIEMIAIIGFYHTVSFFTNGFKIELEAMGAKFTDYNS